MFTGPRVLLIPHYGVSALSVQRNGHASSIRVTAATDLKIDDIAQLLLTTLGCECGDGFNSIFSTKILSEF